MRSRVAVVLLALGALVPAVPASARTFANRCIAFTPAKGKAPAQRFFLKPTALGTYMLYDPKGRYLTAEPDGSIDRGSSPGPAAEWALPRGTRRRWVVHSTLDGREWKRQFFRIRRAHGCRAYPEASLGARGRPRRGSLFGLADPHLHITAALRAGGQVISGGAFDRFGITEALGHDADVHGSDGSLDVTGNLLRSGSPAGTHDTHGWPTFTGWPTPDTYTHQQVYYRWLERAWLGGLRLVVAQTVEDEPLCNIEPRKSHSCDEAATIELQVDQLKALQDYVDAQSGGKRRGWFRLVYSPGQAERVIKRGQLAVIIGVESSNPFGCSEFLTQPHCDRAAIDRGIARMRAIGVRTMFLAHWVDNALAGAALEEGDKGTFIGTMQLAQTGMPFQTGSCPHPGQGVDGQCNTRGLTELGAYAVGRLIDNHMLVEADHLSEWAREDVLKIAEQRHYPLVSSHTGTGGAWDSTELLRLFALGGFASATIDSGPEMIKKVAALRSYGATAVPGIGSDTGGFNALPGPATIRYPFRVYGSRVRFTRERTGTRTFDLGKDGVAHYGLLPDLLAEVAQEPGGRAALRVLFRSAGAYVRTWRLATTS